MSVYTEAQNRLHQAFKELDVDSVKEAFLKYASETDDNKDALRKLAILTLKDKWPKAKAVTGLGVKGSDVLLSDIAYEIENLKLPALIRKRLDISDVEWNAATRIITLIMLSLEQKQD